jgi:hypothetical protein
VPDKKMPRWLKRGVLGKGGNARRRQHQSARDTFIVRRTKIKVNFAAVPHKLYAFSGRMPETA